MWNQITQMLEVIIAIIVETPAGLQSIELLPFQKLNSCVQNSWGRTTKGNAPKVKVSPESRSCVPTWAWFNLRLCLNMVYTMWAAPAAPYTESASPNPQNILSMFMESCDLPLNTQRVNKAHTLRPPRRVSSCGHGASVGREPMALRAL